MTFVSAGERWDRGGVEGDRDEGGDESSGDEGGDESVEGEMSVFRASRMRSVWLFSSDSAAVRSEVCTTSREFEWACRRRVLERVLERVIMLCSAARIGVEELERRIECKEEGYVSCGRTRKTRQGG